MANLFDRVLSLIGKPEDDALFIQLIDDLGETPHVQNKPNGWSRMFSFYQTRLAFVAHLIDDSWIFRGAFMTVEPGIDRVAEYGGYLPNGILADDGRETVERKLGQEPIESHFRSCPTPSGVDEIWEDLYVLPSTELRIGFDSSNGRICHWLISMKTVRELQLNDAL